jgi:hypothetical protein
MESNINASFARLFLNVARNPFTETCISKLRKIFVSVRFPRSDGVMEWLLDVHQR